MKDTMIKNLAERVSKLELEVFKKDRPDYPKYLTIAEFARREGISLTRSEKIKAAHTAVDLCQYRNKPVDFILARGVGAINTYPVEILNEILWSTE